LSRIHRSYRFSEKGIETLEKLEKRLRITKTDVLEQALVVLEEVLNYGVEGAARRWQAEEETT
jgi:hypothetical protein